MSRWIHRTAALALAAAAAVGCAPDAPLAPTEGAPADARSDNAPIQLVTFKDGVDVPTTTQELAREFGFGVRFVRRHAAPGFSAVIPRPLADRLRQDPRVLIVEEDGPVSLIFPIDGLPRDKARPGGGGGAQTTPWGITRVGGAGDGTGKTAWIIDTGIDLDHPDLNTSRACHRNFSSGNSADDGNGHGSHVAGTIAAINNSTGVVGVAANAFVCAVRVLNNAGSGSWESVTNGVNYVAANGANGDVANMSLGGSGSNATLEKAISDAAGKGIKFAIAAGNDGSNAANYTPARVNGANIYTVSAVNSSGCMASWSNYGNPPVDYAAPGVSILSTYKGGGTRTLSGTSMAAPHVAGILLITSVKTDGYASCDPDGNPDPIAHR
jgi:subtilisin family serine protease